MSVKYTLIANEGTAMLKFHFSYRNLTKTEVSGRGLDGFQR